MTLTGEDERASWEQRENNTDLVGGIRLRSENGWEMSENTTLRFKIRPGTSSEDQTEPCKASLPAPGFNSVVKSDLLSVYFEAWLQLFGCKHAP